MTLDDLALVGCMWIFLLPRQHLTHSHTTQPQGGIHPGPQEYRVAPPVGHIRIIPRMNTLNMTVTMMMRN